MVLVVLEVLDVDDELVVGDVDDVEPVVEEPWLAMFLDSAVVGSMVVVGGHSGVPCMSKTSVFISITRVALILNCG